MDLDALRYVSDLVYQRSGIVLGEDKAYLLESRLLPVARTFGQTDIKALVDVLRRSRDEKTIVAVVEAMTTNESSFFRDNKPFDLLRQVVLPKILEQKAPTRHFRIWSAACSTGQEPYTIAMCLREEAMKLTGWQYEIVASDLAQKVIDKAREGVYSQFEVQRGMPVTLLMKYFAQNPQGWELKPEIKSAVSFRQQNLLEDLSRLGRFDIVFCRNVLIYFDEPTKLKVLRAIRNILTPNGALWLGSSETVIHSSGLFKPFEGTQGVYTPI